MKAKLRTVPASCQPEAAPARVENRPHLTLIAGYVDRVESNGAEEADEETIGALIRRLRLAAGKSQYTLAHRLVEVSGNTAVTREEVKRWESQRRIPHPYWREQLSAALRVPLEVLDRAAVAAQAQRDANKCSTAASSTRPCSGVSPLSTSTRLQR
jgi:transcriptional regulator with XRE-family HTH domain